MLSRRSFGRIFVAIGLMFLSAPVLLIIFFALHGEVPAEALQAYFCVGLFGLYWLICGRGVLRERAWARYQALGGAWVVGAFGALMTLGYGAGLRRGIEPQLRLQGALAMALVLVLPAALVLWRFHGRRGRATDDPPKNEEGSSELLQVDQADSGAPETRPAIPLGPMQSFHISHAGVAKAKWRFAWIGAVSLVVFLATVLSRPSIFHTTVEDLLPMLAMAVLIFGVAAAAFLNTAIGRLRAVRFEFDNHLIRQVLDGSSAEIRRDEVRSIQEVANAGLLVSAESTRLWVPATVHRYDDLVDSVSEWGEIEQVSRSARAGWLRLAIFGAIGVAVGALVLWLAPTPLVLYPLVLFGLYLSRRNTKLGAAPLLGLLPRRRR